MRKTILIPTDFTITPLLLLKHAAAQTTTPLDVVFLYCTTLPDSITDLLFYSPKKIIEAAVTTAFSEGCAVIQNKYPEKIQSIRFELFHGRSVDAFQIMAEMSAIDEVIIAQTPFASRKRSFDPAPIIRRSQVPFREVDLESNVYVPERDLLTELFVSAV